ncbi:uncharacterized protein [Triticum aestivum]|uniref:uncharacterized protein n=1 Tax=Triticum aestivum TaxID=4565 RepID=UPI001D028F63|nr:uncharacterized protein LOC123161057 [Triticum aestivum]
MCSSLKRRLYAGEATGSCSAAQLRSGSSSKDTRIIDRAFTLLGFAEGNVQDASEFDLVFVLAVMENTASKLGKLGMKTDLNQVDKLVASVMEAAPVGSAVAARIHVSVILSYGSATANKEEACLILNSSTETDSELKLLRPQITLFCISCRNHHPMLLAQWQQGVTRSDLAKEFSFEEFIKVCDRFIARKLAQQFYDKALAFGLKGYAKLLVLVTLTVIERFVDWMVSWLPMDSFVRWW